MAQTASLIGVPPSEIAFYPITVTKRTTTSSIVCQQHLLALLALLAEALMMPQRSGNHHCQANNIFGTTTKQFVEVEKVFR